MTATLVHRMRGFGTTIFAEMTALAAATGAINLGQGFPDTDGPQRMLDRATRGILDGMNQYPPGPGLPELREAISAHRARHFGASYDPATEILVTVGATEAIAAAVLALCEGGDEVVMFEPYYDSYPAAVALAGGVRRPVTLRPDGPAGQFAFDHDELRAAIGPRTRLLLVNTPHNPTGAVFAPADLQAIADVCLANDLLAISDEVYEQLVYDDARHLPLAGLPGMRERTVTVSSAAKTFSVTGWKIGWVCAPEPLIRAITTVKQFLTFTANAALQAAVAGALEAEDEWVRQLRANLQAGRDRFVAGLREVGFGVHQPSGTYFVQADVRPLGVDEATALARRLPGEAGVVAIPTSVFYDDPGFPRPYLRFAFCKRPEVLDEALSRLAGARLRR